MKHLKNFKTFNEASKSYEGKSAKFHVKGALKDWIFLYNEPGKQIGCEFADDDGLIDQIEEDENCNKIFTSTQNTDVGERPIQIEYKPCKGVEWKDFVKALEEAFDKA